MVYLLYNKKKIKSIVILQLKENLSYVVSTIAKAKPASVKGVFINSITITSTMGPGIF